VLDRLAAERVTEDPRRLRAPDKRAREDDLRVQAEGEEPLRCGAHPGGAVRGQAPRLVVPAGRRAGVLGHAVPHQDELHDRRVIEGRGTGAPPGPQTRPGTCATRRAATTTTASERRSSS